MKGAGRVNGAGVALAAGALGAVASVLPWLLGGGPAVVADTAGALTAAGRVTGLLGAYLALVCVLLLARLPPLERAVGLPRLTRWHRVAAEGCLAALVAHAALVVAGYALGDRLGVLDEVTQLIRGYPGVITATAALVLLLAVGATSATRARRSLRYETWHLTHLYAYLAVVLAFSHQLATGADFVGRPALRAAWTGAHVLVALAVAWYRIAAPVLRSLRHDLRVAAVTEAGPGVVSIDVAGRDLARLGARSGQFFTWRFLTRGRWFAAHPFSLSAAPDGRRLRITVKDLGDGSRGLRGVPAGTRVVAEGPFGVLGARRAPSARTALVAGGVGIAPVRALLEDLPGDVAVVYRAAAADEVLLRDELDGLAAARGAALHYVVGEPLTAERVAELVPDVRDREVLLCGAPSMTAAVRAGLERLGVRRAQIVTEDIGAPDRAPRAVNPDASPPVTHPSGIST